MKERTKNQKGITLIALIITIVVLMILAAVAINSITNDGILSQAGSTANKYNQAVKNEESYLQDYEDVLTALNGGYETYNVGDTVKVGTEEFYVIEDKTAQGKVVLLAKENIDTTNLVQSSTAGTVAFSTTNYWSTIEGITYPYDLTETGVPDASHKAAKAAYDYGVKVGGTGRLMTYAETHTLRSAIILGTDATNGYLNYWLGSAYGDEGVWEVNGENNGLFDTSVIGDETGVRPVVEISKSKLS